MRVASSETEGSEASSADTVGRVEEDEVVSGVSEKESDQTADPAMSVPASRRTTDASKIFLTSSKVRNAIAGARQGLRKPATRFPHYMASSLRELPVTGNRMKGVQQWRWVGSCLRSNHMAPGELGGRVSSPTTWGRGTQGAASHTTTDTTRKSCRGEGESWGSIRG